ncbi:MAG: PrsW family intramembrane metalloprotease [Chitinophagaceae bacterium]|nr:PrsW family intramembrane metalloprotease [Chitinophagaceae bacterium]
MGLLALAIAPGIAICLFIYFKDKYNREPLGLLILSFFMGVLSIIPAVIFQIALTKPVERIMGEGIFYIAVFSYLIVALSEEYSKFLAVRILPYRRKAFDDPFDGILYAVMVSMGFATLENIGYVFQHGFGTGILRMFLSVPAHATFGVLMGYHIGLAKFDTANKSRHMLLAIFWPVLFHGTFDFFLFLPRNDWNGWLLFGGAVVSFIVAVKLSLKLIRRKQEMSKTHFINIDTINKEGHDIL